MAGTRRGRYPATKPSGHHMPHTVLGGKMHKSVIDLINENKAQFSKGHRRIAEYVETHLEQAAYLTAARLGAEVGVSEPTVVRFACSLGYEGYPEFQRDLNDYAKTRLTAPQRIGVAQKLMGDNNSDVLTRILTLDAESVKRTLRTISREDFDGAVEALINARNIYIIGARSAYALACFLDCNLSVIFPSVRLVNDRTASGVFEQLFAAGPGDVVIGISFPRYTQTTVKALRFASRRGAEVIAMTDSEQSPLVPYSNYKLYSQNDIISYYDSLVAPLSVINALLAALSLRKKDEVDKILEGIEEIYAENDIYEKAQDATL